MIRGYCIGGEEENEMFPAAINLIELGCTLKNVGLMISQIFIALDFSSVLTSTLINIFPNKRGSEKRVR